MFRLLHLLTFITGLALANAAQAEIGEDGLHLQPWIEDTFLDLQEDLATAKSLNKDLLILFEQKGCPYCKELHEVNFARDDISNYIQEHYYVLQINMWGNRSVTDFDGEELDEKELSKKWFVQFTPTTIMFDSGGEPPANAREAESFRLPGFLKSFHYLTALEFVVADEYDKMPFQRFIQAKADRLEEQGVEYDLWE